MSPLQKKKQNETDNFFNIFSKFDLTIPFSFRSLFGANSFIFWLGLSVILGLLVFIYLSKYNLIEKIIYKGVAVLLILIMFLWVNLSINIKKYIIVTKVTTGDSEVDEQIIFKLDKTNNQLNFITRPYDNNKEFNKDTVKEVFKEIFLKSLDDINLDTSNNNPIEGPYIYNKEAYVYYINIKTNKPLLSGISRWEKNYRPIPIEDLEDYNKNKTNVRLKYNYNDNVLPILFKLNNKFLEK